MNPELPSAAESPVACHPSPVGSGGDGDIAGPLPIPPDAPDGLRRIRNRQRSRVYESDAARSALARRLLASGDLQEHRR